MPTATLPAPPTPAKPTSPSPAPTPAKPAAPAPVTPDKPARKSFEEDFNAEVAATSPAKAPSSPAKAAEAPKPAETTAKRPEDTEMPPEPGKPPVDDDDEEYLVPKKLRPDDKTKPAPVIPPDQPVKAPELRAAYARSKERVAELEKALAEKAVKPVEDVERKTFTEQITSLQKQLEEASGTIRSAAYEQSKEYKDTYEQPFVDAWNEGAGMVANLPVMNADGESRKGTPDDFQTIMRETDDARAGQLAADMFGPNSAYVLWHRMKIRELNNNRVKALQEYRATVAERTKTETESQAKARESAEQARVQNTIRFKALNDEAVTKYPQFFAPEDGDEEGNKLLERGYRDADLAFQGADMPPEQRVRLHSAIRNKAAAFGRLVHRIAGKDAKIAELEGVIKELRGSAPGPGQVPHGEKADGPLSFEQELLAEMKRG